jgi:ParB family chromosome partitioning protein
VAITLIENIQREELTPAEEASFLQRLVEDCSLTHQTVADADGRSPAAVSSLSDLLDWPAEEVAIADSKARSMGHARALLGFGDDGKRVRLAGSVAERTLAVRATETRVRKALEGKGRAPPAPLHELSVVTEVLRTPEVRVQLQQRSGGPGKFIVEFADTDSRDTINAVIKAAISPSTSRSGKTDPAFRQPSTLV